MNDMTVPMSALCLKPKYFSEVNSLAGLPFQIVTGYLQGIAALFGITLLACFNSFLALRANLHNKVNNFFWPTEKDVVLESPTYF